MEPRALCRLVRSACRPRVAPPGDAAPTTENVPERLSEVGVAERVTEGVHGRVDVAQPVA